MVNTLWNKIVELNKRFDKLCDKAEQKCFGMSMEAKLDEIVDETIPAIYNKGKVKAEPLYNKTKDAIISVIAKTKGGDK